MSEPSREGLSLEAIKDDFTRGHVILSRFTDHLDAMQDKILTGLYDGSVLEMFDAVRTDAASLAFSYGEALGKMMRMAAELKECRDSHVH